MSWAHHSITPTQSLAKTRSFNTTILAIFFLKKKPFVSKNHLEQAPECQQHLCVSIKGTKHVSKTFAFTGSPWRTTGRFVTRWSHNRFEILSVGPTLQSSGVGNISPYLQLFVASLSRVTARVLPKMGISVFGAKISPKGIMDLLNDKGLCLTAAMFAIWLQLSWLLWHVTITDRLLYGHQWRTICKAVKKERKAQEIIKRGLDSWNRISETWQNPLLKKMGLQPRRNVCFTPRVLLLVAHGSRNGPVAKHREIIPNLRKRFLPISSLERCSRSAGLEEKKSIVWL